MKDFIEERDKALKTLDVEYAKKMLGIDCEKTCLISMHKSRYEAVTMPRELRHASGHWLRTHGYKRYTGQELLPEGELPE